MATVQETKWFFATALVSVMTVLVLAWYTFASLKTGESMQAGTVFMLYEYVQRIGLAFYLFAMKYSLTMRQYADLQTVDLILEAEQAHRDDSICLPAVWQQIDIENLSFSIKDGTRLKHQLKDVNLSLRKGRRIALVGKSGSGKSTLLTVLRGLQTTDQVRVKADGGVLAHSLQHLAGSVTLIPQEPEIFANTIKYNISMDLEINSEELERYAELSRFTPILERLPEGFATVISERGVNLSGGEKQRLALARGLFSARHSDIILLDEPTSAVDSQNELKIYKNMFEIYHDRCMISSIHKLHLLPLFDEVYVLEQGEVVEHGSLSELLAANQNMAELWQSYRANHGEHRVGLALT